VTAPEIDAAGELAADRLVAERLQDRLRRDHQTAAALRAYLLSMGADAPVDAEAGAADAH
jgi:hypothetical protein